MPIGEDAIAGYTFKIEIDGQVIAQFKEVSGLSAEVQVIEHRENNISGKEVIKKLPGQKKWGDIILKRGKTDNKVIWEWHKLVMEGKIDEARKNGSIVLYDYARRRDRPLQLRQRVAVEGLDRQPPGRRQRRADGRGHDRPRGPRAGVTVSAATIDTIGIAASRLASRRSRPSTRSCCHAASSTTPARCTATA